MIWEEIFRMYPSSEISSPEISSSGPRDSVATAGNSIQFDCAVACGCFIYQYIIYDVKKFREI